MKTRICCVEDNSRFRLQLTEWWRVIIGSVSLYNRALRHPQLQRAIIDIEILVKCKPHGGMTYQTFGQTAPTGGDVRGWTGWCSGLQWRRCVLSRREQTRQMISSASASCCWRRDWRLLYVNSRQYRTLIDSVIQPTITECEWYFHALVIAARLNEVTESVLPQLSDVDIFINIIQTFIQLFIL